MWATTVNRVTRSGKVQGPDERFSPLKALKTITLWSAIEQFEKKSKGSLKVCKLADMVILSDNPLTIDPVKINKIRVTETVKEGETVFSAPCGRRVRSNPGKPNHCLT
jgi:predicted amidohydrolase YtcJ